VPFDRDEPGSLQQAELARCRRPAEADLARQLRRLSLAQGEQRNDAATSRVSQKFDPGSIPLWHFAGIVAPGT
jgi:hypothetical protein